MHKNNFKKWLKKYDEAIEKTVNEMAVNDKITFSDFYDEIEKLNQRKKHFKSILKSI